jgi:hypothetical protein
MKEWERIVKESRNNLWLVVTEFGSFICKKFRGRFFVKDCVNELPVKGAVLSSVKLCNFL